MDAEGAQMAARSEAPGIACYGPLTKLRMGEGGEGGEQGGEAGERGLASVFAHTTAPQEFAACVSMVQAHLTAARALLAAGNPGDASLTLRHGALRYAGMDALLAARRIDPVQEDLKELSTRAAQGPTLAQLAKDLDAVDARLAAALRTVPADAQAQPDFALGVALALWKQLAARYPAAIDGDTLANEAIYEECWALAQRAATWVQRAEPALRATRADALARLTAAMGQLSAALPEKPPETVAAPKALYTLALRLELGVRQLAKLP
ncbi:MAG TPA: hypothetical protein VF678_07285 [bacterium]